MEATGWVVVGVFVSVINGTPGVSVSATDNMYQTEALCKAQVSQVEERVANVPPRDEVVLVAYGVKCVELKVKSVPPKSNL